MARPISSIINLLLSWLFSDNLFSLIPVVCKEKYSNGFAGYWVEINNDQDRYIWLILIGLSWYLIGLTSNLNGSDNDNTCVELK